MGLWVYGFMGLRIYGFKSLRVYGFTRLQTIESLNPESLNPSVPRGGTTIRDLNFELGILNFESSSPESTAIREGIFESLALCV
jgi:hypothetical protein